MRPSFYHHLHPPTIPTQQARWRYTLGAGGLSLFFAAILLISGLLLMFYYMPRPEEAAQSIQTITFLVPYGWLVRGLHYWAAQMLVVTVLVHLTRVLLTGAYAHPRRLNYLIGLGLLLLTLFLDFSGYVLRWDEGIHWALVVSMNLLKTIPLIGDNLYGFLVGGQQPGPATLLRFYVWHIFGLVLPFLFLVGWHIFRVRRDGGIAAPPFDRQGGNRRMDRFELARREGMAALLAGIALLLVATFIPAPIAPPIGQASAPPVEAHAPWFFLWIQVLLRQGDPFWLGMVVPLVLLALFVMIPYAFPQLSPQDLGRWFPKSGRGAQILTITVMLALLLLSLWGVAL